MAKLGFYLRTQHYVWFRKVWMENTRKKNKKKGIKIEKLKKIESKKKLNQ